MPRKLKPYEVSEHLFKDDTRFKVFLDRNNKDFFVEYAGQTVRADTARECVSKAHELWKSMININWKKVIIVKVPVERSYWVFPNTVALNYDIHTIGLSAAGAWMERTKNPFFDATQRRGNEEEYYQDKYHGYTETNAVHGVYVFPWSEELEASLERIQDAIKDVKQRLDALLGSDDVVMKLLNIRGLALPPVSEEK